MVSKFKSDYFLNDTAFTIYDSEVAYYGGSQHWFLEEAHRRSGCGPVAAANITAYLSLTFPNKYHSLYPYNNQGILTRHDFVRHMIEIRKYVIPGVRGLTSVQQFSDEVISFAHTKGISLTPKILDDHCASMEQAVAFISEALAQELPVAVLVLTHPAEELSEYTWHWMTITGFELDTFANLYYITVTSYGERHRINFNLLWNYRNPQDKVSLAYFI